MSTANSRATRLELGEVTEQGLPGARVLDLDGDLAAVLPDCPVHLADRGRGGGLVVELGGTGPASPGRNRRPGHGAPSWRAAAARIPAAWSGSPGRVRRSPAGRAASKMDRACPNFIAPPLSSPSTRKICSAVRCWISAATISAGRPPSRLPSPSAVRPASPTGSVASLAVRVTARRGRSFTSLIVGYEVPRLPHPHR